MPRELELKLEIAPCDVERLRRHPLLACAEMSVEQQESTYFDTPKRRLRRAGFSLRVRRSGKTITQTVKRQGDGAGLFDRAEWESPVRRMLPDVAAALATPLGDVLSEKRAARLAPAVRMRIQRKAWDVDDSASRIEVAADSGTLVAGDFAEPVSELELELKSGPDSALFDFCEALAKVVPLRLGVLSKADRALALADGRFGKIAKAPDVHLSADMTVSDAFAAIVQSCIKHFRLNEPVLVERQEPEALHQMRVALRRLRSALVLFKPIVGHDAEIARIRKDLRWIGRMLGQARNLDVFSEGLGEAAAELPRLRHKRDEHYARIVVALDSRRFLKLMLRIVRWLAICAWREQESARREIGGFLDHRIDAAWDLVAERDVPLEDMSEEQRHALRIDIKKLRYAVEFAKSLHADHRLKAKRFGSAIDALQDELGALNDMTIARPLARKYLGEASDEEELSRAHLSKAQSEFARLLAIGPYWRPATRRPEAGAARRRASAKRPAVSRMRGLRSGGFARG